MKNNLEIYHKEEISILVHKLIHIKSFGCVCVDSRSAPRVAVYASTCKWTKNRIED
jgi:hypothetical protein